MRYLRAGAGPPLLLLHGFLGYSFSWRCNLVPLSQNFTVYAPDLPGLGYSERSAVIDTDLAVRAEHMLRFMDAMGMEQASVLGTSFGGALATMLAARCEQVSPGRIRRLILVDPVNPWSAHGTQITRFGSTALGAIALRGGFPVIRALHNTFVRRLYGDPHRVSPGTYEGYQAPLAHPDTFRYIISVVRSWRANIEKLDAAYDKLRKMRTLLIWGDRDRAVLPGSAKELQKRLPNSELVMLQGVGHLPYEEVPDQFNEIVLRFLTSDQ